MHARQWVGIVLVVAGVLFVIFSVVTLFAIPVAVVTIVLGILLIVRLGRGEALFPALREQQEYRESMQRLESQPGPVCWRCQRQNRPLATQCEGCGAALSQ